MNSQNTLKRKPQYAKAVRVNMTMNPHLHQMAPELFRKFGFNGISDYVQARMRKDLGLELT